MNQFPRWLLVFNSISTTTVRICLTSVLAIGSGMHYWITSTPPSEVWLIFIAGLAGIDVAQFTAKRVTHREGGASETPSPTTISARSSSKYAPVLDEQDSTASTDIQSLSKKNINTKG